MTTSANRAMRAMRARRRQIVSVLRKGSVTCDGGGGKPGSREMYVAQAGNLLLLVLLHLIGRKGRRAYCLGEQLDDEYLFEKRLARGEAR